MSDLPGWLSALYRARADIETACEKFGHLDAQNDRLHAEVERLREALTPFLAYAAEYRDDEADSTKMPVRIGDLRRARAAMQGEGER